MEIEVEWTERFAYWPVRSSYSKKLIWWKKYHVGEIFYDAMGRPPIKERSWKLVYTKNEYLMMLLRKDEGKWDHPLSNSRY
jgi:predicted nucleotidyltransferase